MKFLPLVVLSLFAIPVQAQGLLDALEQNQASLPSGPGVTQEKAPTGVTAPTVKPSETNTSCDEDKQTSLPLKYLTGLLLQKDAKLDLTHDPAAGTLKVTSAAKMIGNCNSMIQWHMRENEIDGKKVYAVEAKFKDGVICPEGVANPKNDKCYKFTKIGSDKMPVQDAKPFSNDLRGFQSCLEASGVVGTDGKINNAAIFKQPVQESFSGLEETGKLVFLSHGPVSSQVDPRFGLDLINGCDVYEKIHPSVEMVYSSADLESQRLQAEADTLVNCQPNEYHRLVDFIERNGIRGNLDEIRDRLIKQAAEATAKKIADGKDLTDEDMKVIGDFERYIVEPKRKQIADLFIRMESLEGTELQSARSELNRLRSELESLARAPYFMKAHVDKLLAKGMFADAEKMEGIRITIGESAKIGKREGTVTVTPDMARVRIANARGELANKIVSAREDYDIRTGVTTGMAQSYRELASAMRKNIDRRSQNYSQEITCEYARIQQQNPQAKQICGNQSGYCYAYFRNTQKCIQDSTQRITELQNSLAHFNKIDNERAIEFDTKAQQYAAMEQEGRTYQAKLNGEEAPREPATDTTAVPARIDDQNAATSQSMIPPWMMNQTQPYANQTMMNQNQNPYAGMYGSQDSSWMGQAGFSAGFGYQGTQGQNFMGAQQPQYGNVGINWFSMGQGIGQQAFGQQGFGASPFGQMYAQSPYIQQGFGQQGFGQQGFGQQQPWMQQGYSYPNFYGR